MKIRKDILIAFGISCSVACFGLMAHVNDIEPFYDYTHDYSHEKHEYDSQPHHDGEHFPDFATWMNDRLEKEEQAKSFIDKAIGYIQQYADPLTAGSDAASHLCYSQQDDHDRPSAEHESESHY